MPTFRPPTVAEVSPIGYVKRDIPHRLSNRLFRHYSARQRGQNVYLLTNGSITQELPAVLYDGDGALLLTDWDQVDEVWWGGHVATIDDDQAALLTAAGYAPYIT